MAHDVFISYSSHDKMVADAICSKLENNKIRCWIAPRDIIPGDTYGKSIIEAMNGCNIVVIVFSSHSNSSTQVINEIERAVSKSKIIIPFRIENITPSDDMELFLGRRHWLDALTTPLETHIIKLSDTISRLLPAPGGIPVPEPKPAPAPIPRPAQDSIGKLKNGYFFIVEKEDPYFIKFRDQELPIAFQQFKSQNIRANTWFSQAEKMFYNFKTEEAIRFYKRTLEEDPKFLEAYLKLALIAWLHPDGNKNNDAINYCQSGFELNNKHIIGSLLIYLNIENNRTEEARSLIDGLIGSKTIENKNQLAGLYLLRSRLFNVLKEYDQEYENVIIANQISPFFGPALRQLGKIYLSKNESGKAETLLKNAYDEYSKSIFCNNWLNTRDLLLATYGQTGKNELTLQLLNENHRVQELLNIKNEFPASIKGILFEGEIDGIINKGYLINGSGFNFTQAFLQDGIDANNNLLCEFEVNNSPDYCVFYDLRFGGTIVKIDNILFLMKIVQGNNKACLIQTRNEFKLSGIESGFPNLWLIPENSSIKPINISESKSFNLKRV
jgi:tetratricopeptide (TPR) repeat protein